ncbi:MAG TPA: 16S rRNA (cytosine(1402)-N(4))-methyltransferase RsmH [Gammaproteobacteria bacterium]|nr:16S rRNA (cytosine(1402)-N(4))-methyltransferase RsmH [Gammaproteobacteria bacterium]
MKTDVYAHTAVLRDKVLRGLNIRPEGCYVDCTFGRGGHSRAILQQLGPAGRLLAIDKDFAAARSLSKQLQSDPRVTVRQGSFTMLARLVSEFDLTRRVSGILFDLGVSSPQLDDPARGFSFRTSGPLDMRMDNTSGISAGEWLHQADEKTISDVLFQYGEERYARRIAKAIVQKRREEKIRTTSQLAQLVTEVVPRRERDKHPATRTFQALRIVVNRELDELSTALEQTIDVLEAGGRLVVISFHSLEDRIVKRFMRDQSRSDRLPREIPVSGDVSNARFRRIGKVIRPTEDEIRDNPRARSAVMRVAERLA